MATLHHAKLSDLLHRKQTVSATLNELISKLAPDRQDSQSINKCDPPCTQWYYD